jgi:hypothetical protein
MVIVPPFRLCVVPRVLIFGCVVVYVVRTAHGSQAICMYTGGCKTATSCLQQCDGCV